MGRECRWVERETRRERKGGRKERGRGKEGQGGGMQEGRRKDGLRVSKTQMVGVMENGEEERRLQSRD